MSLDVYLVEQQPVSVFSSRITHNLAPMARAAGIYQHLWRPDELGIVHARELLAPLREGLAILVSDRYRFKGLNPANGWGTYDNLVEFVQEYLHECEEHPDAVVKVWR